MIAQASAQLQFPEMAFPADRATLTVAECARKIGYTEEHIIALIECGQLRALNCATQMDTVRVPRGWLAAVARRQGCSEEALFGEIEAAKAAARPAGRRPSYRIPSSAWSAFIAIHTT
jgi:hypothetical protein